ASPAHAPSETPKVEAPKVEPRQVSMSQEMQQPVTMKIEPQLESKLEPIAPAGRMSDTTDVIDLPGDVGENAIVEAILKHYSGELVECPISPPMCPRARLAVSRDRRVVMLAVA